MSSTVSTAAVDNDQVIASNYNLTDLEHLTFVSHVKDIQEEIKGHLKSLKDANDVFSDKTKVNSEEMKEIFKLEVELKGWEETGEQLASNKFSNICSAKGCKEFIGLSRLKIGAKTCKIHANQ